MRCCACAGRGCAHLRAGGADRAAAALGRVRATCARETRRKWDDRRGEGEGPRVKAREGGAAPVDEAAADSLEQCLNLP